MKPILMMALPLSLLAACATNETRTAEQRAQCERMAERMGIASTHDHAQMKGTPGSGMNARHQRCARMLRDTSAASGG